MQNYCRRVVRLAPCVFLPFLMASVAWIGAFALHHVEAGAASDSQTIILAPLWREGEYWKPESYIGHANKGWEYAVDFYFLPGLSRPDTYRGSEKAQTTSILAPHAGDVYIYLFDATELVRQRAGKKNNFEEVKFNTEGTPNPIPRGPFSVTPSDKKKPAVYIDVGLIIQSPGEKVVQFCTWYTHLRIHERFFSEKVLGIISGVCKTLRGGGSLEVKRVAAGKVEVGEVIGWIDELGMAQYPHLHFQVRRGDKDAGPEEALNLVGSSEVTIGGEAILLPDNDPLCLKEDGIFRYPAMPRRRLAPGSRVKVATSWDKVDYWKKVLPEGVKEGDVGTVKRGPEMRAFQVVGGKRHFVSFVSYEVEFPTQRITEWVPGAYLDLSESVELGLQWLRGSQQENGSWSNSTGITALALLALLNSGASVEDPAVSKGLKYLLDPQRYDAATGQFSGDKRGDSPCYTYDTALAILVLVATEDRARPRSEYREIVAKARGYLLSIQHTNPDNPDDPQIGGWGYPRPGWTDLSNTQFAVMALDAAYDYLREVKPPPTDANSWTGRLLRYLDRCQNDDGGFGYRPGQASWGSMSAAGLWSLVLTGVSPTDSRVKRVIQWMSANYRLDANPGRGSKALYYYYLTLSKALTMVDLWEITTADGRKHYWYPELDTQLERLLSPDGYWVNEDGSEWEENRDLCTAYAILALQVQRLPASRQLSWVLTLHSPAELHLYDWLGHHVGRNEKTGRVDSEIPGSSFSVGPRGEQIITLSMPQAGRYRIEIVGTGTGAFTLESNGYLGERLVSSEKISGRILTGQAKATTATLTSMVGPLTVYIGELQSVPYGLEAVPGKGYVDLSWRSFVDWDFRLKGYAIYRSTTSRLGYTRIATVPAPQTNYRDSTVLPGTTYYYVISAIAEDDGETPQSREVSATPFGVFPGTITVGPNPVGRDGCAFFYIVPEGTRQAVILIFDVSGRKVAELSIDPTGRRHPATGRWEAVDQGGVPLANGPYVYVLVADGRVIGQGKMVIQR